jgi:hypothetical protein
MKSLHLIRGFLIVFALCAVGCGPTEFTVTKKTSYADLVVTYNAEVQALDNLEGKRKQLLEEFSNQAQAQAIKSAFQSLESGAPSKSPSNPNEALDRAVAAAELQAQLQSGLVEKLGQSPSGSTSAANVEYPEELKRKLADLDAEIATQKERVERARNARNAAEPK